MARTGIQHKRRRYVHKKQQDTSGVYGGSGSRNRSKGGNYAQSDNTLKKTQGYDTLSGLNKERRGRKGSDSGKGRRGRN